MSKESVVIVGAGIFGMSTALWMLQTNEYDVTILDKSEILPAPDAASSDLNKIIRAGDYADPHLASLSLEAIGAWRQPEWENTFHQSGQALAAKVSDPKTRGFVMSSLAQCERMGVKAIHAQTSDQLQGFFPGIRTGKFEGLEGYLNTSGGWAEATRAMKLGLERVRQLGGRVRSGAQVVGLIKDGIKVKGVILNDGEEVLCDLLVIATGAWTPGLFASTGISSRLPPIIATGQSVATIQLNEEEAQRYFKVPVVFLNNQFYVFPPDPNGIVKFAIHNPGYLNPAENGVSIPHTILTPGAEDGMIPREMILELREGLRSVYPELAGNSFVTTRLCWYCDTVSGDWLIDYHPEYENLVLATGGSGHAFKFAPIIGREILKVIKRIPSPEWADRWAFQMNKEDVGADIRHGERKLLDLNQLATKEDLGIFRVVERMTIQVGLASRLVKHL
ncbi:hypothetical protein TREMEDRAFT_60999 [Tremella mesenterica DSM 1558]|uniref:uncharacterized protein n=1 Tax=Tremella mesenterica (strain ATCC 24925 / CBS 8224 / DSM 1558 / NBRC 9311 / NRRL Y-6157 / RJB 2259-6 / UBC 559-6) TaxID=578456 RepID=UPI0003F4A2E8|nr:uncharacterized protein TREMEDRAFT_60999 [Tremella mesenterica DSM 1558]EIW70496.1 hypothetical protein TREMEDRAFT_60999 [Tremella mesenterica DSM 1558]